MKIFSWMQSKVNAKQGTKTPNLLATNDRHNKLQELPKDEFSDWPHGLLAIGTFGNNNTTNLKENEGNVDEQVGEIKKELKLLLEKQEFSAESTSGEEEEEELENCDDSLGNENPLQRSNSAIIGRGKDILCDNNSYGKNGIIGKKSVSFLLKKTFLCRSGFTSHPSLRDSLPDPRLDKSRMEKILRAILHKKIYPQSTTPKSSGTNAKKYLQNNKDKSISEREDEKGNEGSKWVKTDSDFIVLEI